jgi:hypothetical protein
LDGLVRLLGLVLMGFWLFFIFFLLLLLLVALVATCVGWQAAKHAAGSARRWRGGGGEEGGGGGLEGAVARLAEGGRWCRGGPGVEGILGWWSGSGGRGGVKGGVARCCRCPVHLLGVAGGGGEAEAVEVDVGRFGLEEGGLLGAWTVAENGGALGADGAGRTDGLGGGGTVDLFEEVDHVELAAGAPSPVFEHRDGCSLPFGGLGDSYGFVGAEERRCVYFDGARCEDGYLKG